MAPADEEMPGMWETADLVGGETDCVAYLNLGDIDLEAVDGGVRLSNGDPYENVILDRHQVAALAEWLQVWLTGGEG